MDFSADDELDYEEDGLDKDSAKNYSESMNCLRNGVKKDPLVPSCEGDYLQINCSDEEENFVSGEELTETVAPENFVSGEQPSETGNPETTDAEVQKGEDIKETKKKILSAKEFSSQSNRLNDFKHNDGGPNPKKIKKNCAWSLRRQPPAKKNNSPARNLWLSDFPMAGVPTEPRNGLPVPIRPFGQRPEEQHPHLGQPLADAIRSSSPGETAVGCSGSTPQQHNPVTSEIVTPFSDEFSESKTDDGDSTNPSENSGCNVSDENEKSKNDGSPEKKTDGDDFIPTRRPGKPSPLGECLWKSERTIGKRKKYAIRINGLKDDEKQLMKMKKEARRERFMRDATTTEREPSAPKNPAKCLPDELSRTGEGKFLLGKFQRRDNEEGKNYQSFFLGKMNLKKEILLKKRNPFDGTPDTTSCLAATRIKQEVAWSEDLKAETPETKAFSDLYGTNDRSLFFVKNDPSSQVKFVRTISKSLDELGFGKRKNGAASVLRALPFAREHVQEQVTRQLTGCIVKVLNVPPSTTTNDVLTLCNDIGTVREVKLNFPKENSVVIRFAEPSSAENFFSLYHGQKMDNYFLNVIVI